MNSIIIIIFIINLIATFTSGHVIKYDHKIDFIKYEVNERNSTEENNLTVNIYSIEAMETAFRVLVEKLKLQQQQLFKDKENLYKDLYQQLNNNNRNFNSDIKNVIDAVNKGLRDYEKVKNETDEKKLQLRQNYMQGLLLLENEIKDYNMNNKARVIQLNNQKNLLTIELNKCKECKNERIESLKRELKAVERSINIENDNFNKETLPIQENINKLMENLTQELINTLEKSNKNYENILKNFDLSKLLEKCLKDFSDKFVQYLKTKSKIDSDFQTIMLKLTTNLKFDNIKPNEHELIYETDHFEMKNHNFVEKFLKTAYGHQSIRKASTSQQLIVDEPTHLKWEKIHEDTPFIPKYPVIAGYDVDKSPLYVIRIKKNGRYFYGKYAHSDGRKNAYIPFDDAERGEFRVELLTSPNYKWCKFESTKYYQNLPVCRVKYNNLLIPGTLQSDGLCRIGYAWKVYRIKDDIEVLGIDEC